MSDSDSDDPPLVKPEKKEKKDKRKKREPSPEPSEHTASESEEKNEESEPESDPPTEDDASDADEDPEKRRKRILKLKRLNKKVSGYRRKAKEAGYARGATAVEASGLDAFMSCISNSDARRLMKYFPENIGNSSYDKDEFNDRIGLSIESIPPSAAREAQARIEAVFRGIINEAALRATEGGKMRIDAGIIQSILRKYTPYLKYTAVTPPIGLVRYAQEMSILGSSELDATKTSDDKHIAKKMKEIQATIEERKARFREKQQESLAKKAQAAA